MRIIGLLGFIIISIIASIKEDRINFFLNSHKKLKCILPFLICFIISFLIAILFALSPFNNSNPGVDSSVFLYIGKSMRKGVVPYKDIFDHKGSFLYFIEYLGYLIGFGNSVGVWIIELFNIYLTTLILYYIVRLLVSSKVTCYLCVFIVSYFLMKIFEIEGGNLTEEYALPWIALSLYITIKFFINNMLKKRHIIALGVSFSIVFFLRVNMVGLWGTLLLTITVYLIRTKRIKDIFKCAIFFILGCLIVIVPLIIYLVVTKSFKYMIDYYFVFNFSYTKSASIKDIITAFLYFVNNMGLPVFCVVYSLITNYKNKIIWVNLATLLTAFMSCGISGRCYLHYIIILMPLFVIPVALTIAPLMEKTIKIPTIINKNKILKVVLAISVLCVAINPVHYIYEKITTPSKLMELYSYLEEKTSEEDDVLILGNCANVYLLTNRHTKNKFFYQSPPIDMNEKMYEEFISELKIHPSDYIVYLYSADVNLELDTLNRIKIYLNNECEKGIYQLEEYNDFQVYVRV